jgi:hypothetical protein
MRTMLQSPDLFRCAALCLALSAAASSAGGCQLILGIGGELPLEEGGAGGTPATGGSAGAAGAGGAGGSPPEPCDPGEEAACYSGPPGTAGVGRCKSGTAVCGRLGDWGPCVREALPSPESCITPDDEDCNGADCAVWMRTVPGKAFGTGVGVDGQGNIVASLQYTGPTDLGDGVVKPVGNSDIALFKYDRTGELLWKRVLVAEDDQTLQSIHVDAAGYIVICGETRAPLDLGGAAGAVGPGAYVARLDPDGNSLWARTGKSDKEVPDVAFVAQDSKGDVIAGGNWPNIHFGTEHVSGPDFQGFFLMKLSAATGEIQWLKATQAAGDEALGGIVIDPADNIVLTGVLDGPELGLHDGDLPNCCGARSSFLARLSPGGAPLGGVILAQEGERTIVDPNGLAVDRDGVATIVGTFIGTFAPASGTYVTEQTEAGFVLREATATSPEWSRAYYTATATSTAHHAGADSKGNIVFAGTFGGDLDLGDGLPPPLRDSYVLKLDSAGNFLWVRTFALGQGAVQALAVGPLEDETAVVGTFFTHADIGAGKAEAPQGVFIGKLGH